MIENLLILIWITFLIGGITQQKNKAIFNIIIIGGLITLGIVLFFRIIQGE